MFDICVVDTDPQSYQNQTPFAVLSSPEHNKKKYSQACQDQKATFTPLCVSIDGMIGHDVTAFLQWIADLLSAKLEMDYDLVWDRYVLDCLLLFFMQHFCVFKCVTLSGTHLE